MINGHVAAFEAKLTFKSIHHLLPQLHLPPHKVVPVQI